MEWIVTGDEIGELLGVQKRQIYNFIKQGMPKAAKGRFHAPTCVQWFVDERSSGETGDINEQRKKLYKAQTDKTELENAKLRGGLLESDVVQTVILELATLVGTQIDSIEPRMARKLPPDLTAELRLELKALREAISDGVRDYADTRDCGGDHPSAS